VAVALTGVPKSKTCGVAAKGSSVAAAPAGIVSSRFGSEGSPKASPGGGLTYGTKGVG
jgi:hypothetical protein